MALTTYAYINADNFTSGSYLACAVKITATRASSSSKNVTIKCESHLGFGSYADSTSHEGGTIYADLWYGGSTWASRTAGAYATVSTGSWSYSGSWSRLSSDDSKLTQYAYTPHKSNTFSFTVTNWTSGSSIKLYYDVEGPNSHTIQNVNIACPDYYTNASVSMTTESQTVNPGGTIKLQWSGTNGTNNSISKYYLYYGGTNVYSGTSTSYTVDVPAANSSKKAYVKATATYNTPSSSEITITTRDYGTPTATISTSSQTLKSDQTLTISWSGSAGTSNPISKYQLYYNGSKVYEGTSTSFTVNAPPVDSSYKAYVNAVGTYGNKVGKSSEITITTAPYMWVMVSGVWKSVQSVYICVNGEWKQEDPSNPIGVRIGDAWKEV